MHGTTACCASSMITFVIDGVVNETNDVCSSSELREESSRNICDEISQCPEIAASRPRHHLKVYILSLMSSVQNTKDVPMYEYSTYLYYCI